MGRLGFGDQDGIIYAMNYHPRYLDCFLRTQNFMLTGNGPLPYDYRYYIGIMAAARHKCSYIVNKMKEEFLLQGGKEEWLTSFESIPQKLQNLNTINKILAHQPWTITKDHISELLVGPYSWTVSEIVHALVLLAHFHNLPSFVWGCGIDDNITCKDSNDQSINSVNSGGEEGGSVQYLMERMKSISENSDKKLKEDSLKTFESVVSSQDLGVQSHGTDVSKDVQMFVRDSLFCYQDFAKRNEPSSFSTLRIQDYCWEEHAFSLICELYNDVGILLDEKFKLSYSLTYYTMGPEKGVDTSFFRRAVWNYVHCLFGVRHDDYNYQEVNTLITRPLKTFIKIVCCFPEKIRKSDMDMVMPEFKYSEKIHVLLMVMEARLQAELLYSLRVLMQYRT